MTRMISSWAVTLCGTKLTETALAKRSGALAAFAERGKMARGAVHMHSDRISPGPGCVPFELLPEGHSARRWGGAH